MRFIAFLAFGVLCPIMSFAQDVKHAKVVMAQELTQCAGYYYALSVKEGTSQPAEASIAHQEKGKRALEAAKTYNSDERELGMMGGAAVEVFIFMKEPEWEKIKHELAEPCKSILEKPEDRFQYWLNK